ncbi:MAG: glycosyltransferase family 39 protein [Muribaculaceae bacterium]|nr:glycosyltransferase family 39 protein [Muribaculaceae bacterium]
MKIKNIYLVLIVVVSALCLLVGLDSTLFSTKGEPREALVAVEILSTGNWILPALDGVDLPYKPPMLAWLIAVFSYFGGRVTEFTARIPSVLAMIAMLVMCFEFFRRRANNGKDDALKAFVTSMILLAVVETHRSAIACRVDMVLTAFMTAAIFSLYNWQQSEWKGFPIIAVLAMSAATLTKGPIGIALPCFVVFVFALTKGQRFWGVTWRLAVTAIAALIIPAVYYYAAYSQGGDAFLSLAMEENFGRLTGTMSYESHVHPFYYNFITLIVGFLPFTLFLIFSLFAVKYSRPSTDFRHYLGRFRAADPKLAFSAAAAALIVLVFCIPASKRSVYLLPAYPFIAFLIAEWLVRLRRRHSHIIKAYNYFLIAIAIIVVAVFAEIYLNIFGLKEHLPASLNDNIRAVALTRHSLFDAILIGLPIVAAVYALMIRRRPTSDKHIYAMLGMSLTIYLAVTVAFINPILNKKSDFDKAKEIATIIPSGKILSSIKSDKYIRFYTIDFYTDNRLVPWAFASAEPLPPSANILLCSDEADEFIAAHTDSDFRLLWDSEKTNPDAPKSCDVRRPIRLYSFKSRAVEVADTVSATPSLK